jgi:hypothetical protein
MPVGGSGPNFLDKRRVVKVYAKIRNTLGLRVNGREIPSTKWDIHNFDEPATPVTANINLEETSNWDDKQDKLVTLDQIDPVPLELLVLKVKLESEP